MDCVKMSAERDFWNPIAFYRMQNKKSCFELRIVSKITIYAISFTYGTIRKICFYYGIRRAILALRRARDCLRT